MVLTRGDGSTLKFTPQPTARVFSDDFEAGAAPQWSTSFTTVTPVGARRFLGRFFGAGATNLTLSGLGPHSAIVISLELFIIQSMDGNNTSFGPDEWNLRVDGQPVFRTTFAFFDTVFNFRQAFPEAFPGGDFPGGTHLGRTGGLGNQYLGILFLQHRPGGFGLHPELHGPA